MQCPVDGNQLVMTDRNGVEIDYCPQCRGVWLDRGELDKIIDRSGAAAMPPPPPVQHDTRQPARHTQKRRKNPAAELLGELFDF